MRRKLRPCMQANARREKDELLKMQCEQVRESLPSKTERTVELATEKGASNWLTVIPIKEMNFNLNKREFRDAIKLRYDWEIGDLPAMCTCGDLFTVDHAMVCRHGGLNTFVNFGVSQPPLSYKKGSYMYKKRKDGVLHRDGDPDSKHFHVPFKAIFDVGAQVFAS